MNEEHKQLFTAYIKEEEIRGHTIQGLIGLKNRLPRLFEYMEIYDLSYTQFRIAQAQGYQGWLIETGKKSGGNYSSRTIKTYLTAATSFFNFLKRNKLIYSNPFLDIRRPGRELKLPKNLLKEKEMGIFLKELRRYDEEPTLKAKISHYRIHVIAELMYATGLRSSEVAELNVEDIDFTRGTVKVIEGKGGSDRIAFLNDYALTILRLYVDEMRELTFNEWNERNGTLFGTKWGSFNKAVNKVLKKISLRLELPILTSHDFRHAIGYHLLRSGCDIRYIQNILGHKRITSTEIYTKVDKEALKEVLDKYHPRQFREKNNEKPRP